MGIRLRWDDPNFGEDGHKLYRSMSPMDPFDLPAPIATLAANVTSFDDGDVVGGEVYYYRVSATSGENEAVSDEISILAVDFDPALLFSNAQVGAWYDPSDLTTMFQDVAGTIPISADGQLVARINDKSGGGHHLTGASTASRPKYRTDGIRHWLEFDGVGNILTCGSNNIFRNVGSGIMATALRSVGPVSTGSEGQHFIQLSTPTGSSRAALLSRNGNHGIGGRMLDAGAFLAHEAPGEWPADAIGTAMVTHFNYSERSLNAYFGTGLHWTVNPWFSGGVTSNTASSGLGVGGDPLGARYSKVEIYQVILVGDANHSAEDIDLLTGWLEGKASL